MGSAAVDVVIIGGGIVGTVLAKALSEGVSYNNIEAKHDGLRVVLIDAADPLETQGTLNDFNPFTDTRVIALSRRTVNELAAVGLSLDSLAKQHNGELPPDIKHIEVSDKGHVGLLNLHSDDYHVDAFGQVVSLGAFTRLAAHASAAYQHLAPAKVVSVKQHLDHVDILLDSGEALTTKLLVLADGGRSRLAESVGIKKTITDYHQTAIVFNVHTQMPHDNKAYERFTDSGPLAFLPFDSEINGVKAKGNGFSVVWTVETQAADALMAMNNDAFITALQQAFGYRQGTIKRVSSKASYPLALTKAERVATHRTVVIGNAAQSLHPIAGQGFNLGLRDISALLFVLKNALLELSAQHAKSNDNEQRREQKKHNSAFDAGAFSVVQRYAHERKKDRANTIVLTDTLVRTFSNHYFPTVIGRNISLLALSMMPEAKKTFVKHTTGYGITPDRNRDNNAAC